MAIVIIGGLVTSTLLVLFLVPAIYQRVVSSPRGVLETEHSTDGLGPRAVDGVGDDVMRRLPLVDPGPDRRQRPRSPPVPRPPRSRPARKAGDPVEDIAGSDVKRLTLTRGCGRTDRHRDGPVTSASGGHTIVPVRAGDLRRRGQTWVFTSPETDVFVRAPRHARSTSTATTRTALRRSAGRHRGRDGRRRRAVRLGARRRGSRVTTAPAA